MAVQSISIHNIILKFVVIVFNSLGAVALFHLILDSLESAIHGTWSAQWCL